jgi:hypothetical protein
LAAISVQGFGVVWVDLEINLTKIHLDRFKSFSILEQRNNKKKWLRENAAIFFVQNFNADLMWFFG